MPDLQEASQIRRPRPSDASLVREVAQVSLGRRGVTSTASSCVASHTAFVQMVVQAEGANVFAAPKTVVQTRGPFLPTTVALGGRHSCLPSRVLRLSGLTNPRILCYEYKYFQPTVAICLDGLAQLKHDRRTGSCITLSPFDPVDSIGGPRPLPRRKSEALQKSSVDTELTPPTPVVDESARLPHHYCRFGRRRGELIIVLVYGKTQELRIYKKANCPFYIVGFHATPNQLGSEFVIRHLLRSPPEIQ